MKILASLLLAQALTVSDVPLDPPTYQVRQGQTLVIPVNADACGTSLVQVLGQHLRCRPDGTLIIGIDIAAPPGVYEVSCQQKVLAHISVTTVEWQSPAPRAKARKPKVNTTAESVVISNALAIGPLAYPNYHVRKLFSDPLDRMAPTDVFGWKRTWRYPDDTTSTDQHRGQDLVAATGTPVYAMASGIVVYEGASAREGGMVILYHGDNIYSLYLHLSATVGPTGTMIGAGQPIGSSGATGNITGPHLHWAVKIGTAAVDPNQALRTLRERLP